MPLNAEELAGRVCPLIQDFDPDLEGSRTWDDAIRRVLRVIDLMEAASHPHLKEMSEDERRQYYKGKQRESRKRKKMRGEQ